ncbi:MAG TPA: glycosyl hydrolase 115 family protein [Burkholderiaceae bacterium]
MKLLLRAAVAVGMVGMVVAGPAHALGQQGFVSFAPPPNTAGAVALADARVVVDAADFPGVQRAAGDLKADIAKVTGRKPGAFVDADAADTIIIGTLGKSALIDRLVAEGKFDASGLRGHWEAWRVQVVLKPQPGVERALVIAGSDLRGTVYGIYGLSEQIGVSPWNWWADVPPQHHAQLFVAANTAVADQPVVRYRGIFLNDEAPALSGWVKEHYGKYDHRFYGRLFELILRLRGNMLWPAMWGSAFFADDPLNGQTAADYGVVIGTSHHEPLMRAHREWADAKDVGPPPAGTQSAPRGGQAGLGSGPAPGLGGAWNYTSNAAALREFWSGGLKQSRGTERLITIGMRGDGDEAMSADNNIPLLERIVHDQRELIKQEPDAATAPQVWALYKEVQSYYEQGMRVPDDVTLLWSDDNWGNLRRLPTPEERKRKGGAGVYYHFDYVGGPRSYKWLNDTPIPKIWEQMNLAAQYGADKIWIVNVGDLKPMEVPIEFFLTQAWNPAAMSVDRMTQFTRDWATRDFGPEHAAEIAELVDRYTQYNGRRKPEQLAPDTYSLVNYREAETVAADYHALAVRAEALYAQLPQEQRAAFFELVLYPVKACATVNELYDAVARNRLYARQGRASTNTMAAEARRLFAQDAALTRQYNEELLGGKWNHMMDQTHLGYYAWFDPPLNVMPAVSEVQPAAGAEMAVAVEGDETGSVRTQTLSLPALDAFSAKPRRIELFNRGLKPFHFTAKSSAPWLVVSPASGQVQGDQALSVAVRWADAPAGLSDAKVLLRSDDGREFTVNVPISNPSKKGVSGFVETDGVISIEAEHYGRAVAVPGREWLRIPGHGRTLSGMSTMPGTASSPASSDMRLEYPMHLFNSGKVHVIVTLAPTQKFQPGPGLRFAVSIDEEKPQIVNMHADESPAYWDRSVSDGAVTFSTDHVIATPGAHTLKFWALDAGVVLQKLVVDAGGLKPSYLGPPESPFVPLSANAK